MNASSWRDPPLLPVPVPPRALPKLGRFEDEVRRTGQVYEPSDDTYLFVDAIRGLAGTLSKGLSGPPVCLELGGGSGVLSATLGEELAALGSLHIVTDVNAKAAEACAATLDENGVTGRSDVVLCDLVSSFSPVAFRGLVDVLLFNPPYVPTPSEEVGSRDISAAWAGGLRGREVLDRLLPRLDRLMSANSIVLLLLVEENDPDEIASILAASGGFVCRVAASRRAQNERLMVFAAYRGLVPLPPV